MSECLSDDTIALFLDGRLDDAARSRARAHIDVCEACRQLLADAAMPASDSEDVVAPVGPVMIAPGHVVAGKYEILRVIGGGGMGQVVSARHVGLDKHVAIKVMHPELLAEPDVVRRFLREARAASRLASEHVVRIHDVDQLPSGLPYIVMELLDGDDLHTLQSRRTLGIEEAVGYALQAAEALVEAHASGLIHRDLKPQNLFLTRPAGGDEPCVKVLDFGLAKDLSGTRDGAASLTSDGAILGSPEYMSPEQIQSSKDVDRRTDVWALGATLFELLAGRPPFESPTVRGLLASILADAAPSVRQYRAEVPEGIERAIARALDKSLASRFPDIETFAAALRAEGTSTAVGVDRTIELGTAATVPTAPSAIAVATAAGSGARASGRFRLLGSLGSGGMAEVHRAYDSLLDRQVALKILRRTRGADDAQGRRRVLREARAAAALTHPNTVTIFDVGEDADGVFIAMELLEGEDLRAVIARGDASRHDKLRWLRDAARALAAAHQRGLVHRDVKPANIFICADGALKLLDFGIAKRAEESVVTDTGPDSIGPSSMQTRDGRTLGTPRYMAPEQRAGQPTDGRTDQYAWGLVARELLTDVPEPLASAVARALGPTKEDRFPSMQPIVEVLDGTLDGGARPARKGRASWLAVAVAGAIAVGVLGAGAVAIGRFAKVKSPGKLLAAACTVGPLRSIELSPDDRIGVDATGAVIVARDFRKQPPRLEREEGGGWAPLAYPPSALGGQWPLENLTLAGTHYLNRPATAFILEQGRAQGAVMVVIEPGGSSGTLRIFGPLTGVALTSLRDSPVAIATTEAGAPRRAGRPGAIEAHRLRPADSKVIAMGGGKDPSAAASDDALAVAFATDTGMRFVLLDRELERIGEELDVSRARTAPAVAFDGKRVSVFWTEGEDHARRLMAATWATSEKAFSAPHVAIEEPVAKSTPIAVRSTDGVWGLAWVASSGASSVLRFAKVDVTGGLVAAIDVARAPAIDLIQASAATLIWREGAGAARAASVSCELAGAR